MRTRDPAPPRTARPRRAAWPLALATGLPLATRPRTRRPRPTARPRAACATATRQQTPSRSTPATGYVSTPDGNSIYMWSYGRSGRGFQLPGPDAVRRDRRARSPWCCTTRCREATSIVFPGADARDGQRRRRPQPQFDAGGTLTSLVQPRRRRRATARSPTRSPPAAPGTLPLRVGHRRATSSARWACTARWSCPRRPAHPAPGERSRRLGVRHRRTSTCSCSPRSTRTCTSAVERNRPYRLQRRSRPATS